MANLTVKTLLDRIDTINGLITGTDGASLNNERYFPGNLPNARMPLIVPFYQAGTTRNDTWGANEFVRGRTVMLYFWAGNLMSGYPTKSAQQAQENFIDAILTAYAQRPRLQSTQAANDPLDSIVEDCQLTNDRLIPDESFLVVQFTLVVPVSHTIERF